MGMAIRPPSRAPINWPPPAARGCLTGEIDREIDSRLATGFGRFVIVSRLLHSMHSIVGKEAALLTRLRCARTALAIENYRLAHNGILPKHLNQLITTYLPELSRDPAEGEPLQFEPMKSGYQISSPAAAARLKNSRSAKFSVMP
jgi:hypothetical protein